MAKSIVAAALTGMMTPPVYRNTPYGPARDPQASMASAFKAGADVTAKRQQAAQNLTDSEQARRLMTVQNNANLLQLMTASTHLKHQGLEDLYNSSKEFLSPFETYDTLRDQNAPPAFLNRGMTVDEIFKSGHKLTDANVVLDGIQPSPDGGIPLYSIINPALKDVQLPENVTKKLAAINSQFQNIHSITGGNVRIPVTAYISAMHDYDAVTQSERILNTLNAELNGKNAKPIDLAPVVRENRQLIPGLWALSHPVSAGNTPTEQPDRLLQAILEGDKTGQLLPLLGLNPAQAQQKIDDIQNERKKNAYLAGVGGVGEKAIAPPTVIDSLRKNIAALPKDDADRLSTDIVPNMTAGQVEKLTARINETVKTNKENAIKQGDPVELTNQANQLINGDLSSVKDLLTSRQNVRSKLDTILWNEASKRGLDPTKYTLSAQQAKSDLFKDYSGASTKIGASLVSFNTFLGHEADAIQANKNWVRSGSPLVNRPLSWLETNAANDPDFLRFKTSLLGPAKEYMSFLNANRAEHEADIASMDKVLDPNSTPLAALTALKELARTADIRAAALGQKYLDSVGATYPVITPQSAGTLKALGIDSQAAPLSVPLPRGWQNNQATPITKETAAKFFAASGGNKDAAMNLAKQNGWSF